ncbi:MAG: hypothetical protein COU90_01435 [Candidatus Ryanbacteria bacterium CG10_big_fil_rev_8_21_14_0_10_43_42]|uniref:Ribosome-binding factor A n=1 Tax=Candidatus Ryanbacteria bacterium CG10_big_fil_rev_8_21_14_0_10_43_42 TaxID=1974864 RepID=A0A2M8KXP2_9BACT|nr:MAG: hypothetical protein COU90_01435 [Candidatus Ryanbacteria bacterium CG10_big_fil_rev_8_21_14_0_10_43_42]
MDDIRNERTLSLLKEIAGRFIQEEVDVPPGMLLTVMRVEWGADKTHAIVYVSPFPTNRVGMVLEKLRRLQLPFNTYARKKLGMKHIPDIRFYLDDTEVKKDREEKMSEE